jgi:predicted Zn-dependent peptidase
MKTPPMKPVLLSTMLALVLLLSALPASTALAAEAKLPAELPPFGADRSLPVPKITQRTLANGLQVWVVPRQGLPRVDAVLVLRGAGFAADAPGQNGFASLLAGVLTEGTVRRDSRAIAEAAQGLGGSISASSSNDGISVSANALASGAAPLLELLAEVVRSPAYSDNEVTLAKANALQGLKASEAQPGFRAERALSDAIFGDHPYARAQPTAEAIAAVTAEGLRGAHARRFRPDHALLVVAGRIDDAQALQLVEAAFGDWQAIGTAVANTPLARTAAPGARVLLERPGSVQATLRLGRPGIAASAEDQVPLSLTSTILGGGFSSRVNLKLREEKGYTYGASAGARNYRDGGAIVGGADVRNEVAGAALAEFMAEYQRIGSQPVGSQEIQETKRFVAGSYVLSTQLQGSLARQLAANWLIGLPADYLGRFVPLVRQVTAAQVLAMGRKYFAPQDQSIVVVGDKAALAEQLKAYGEFVSPAK